ncbi:hypothetical protein DFH27DRAFT_313784 [Peziza echinospora]|nr:hypothetical protein DFH27DRAFT_313784 [Peziza echinospora]
MFSTSAMEKYDLNQRKRRRSTEDEPELYRPRIMRSPGAIRLEYGANVDPIPAQYEKPITTPSQASSSHLNKGASIPEATSSDATLELKIPDQATTNDALLEKNFDREIIFIHEFETRALHFTYGGFVPDSRLPQPVLVTDSLEILAQKLRKIVDYGIKTRQSLAVATGYLTTQKLKEHDPVGNAIATVDRLGSDGWDIFCSGLVRRERGETGHFEIDKWLTPVDWSAPQFSLPIGEEAIHGKPPSARVQKTFDRRAKALQFLFKNPDITPENAKWFTMNRLLMLPLVKAVDRMLAAIGTMRWGREKGKAMMVQEEVAFLKHTVALAEGILYGIPASLIEATTGPNRMRARKTSMVQAEYLLARKRARMAAEPATGSRSADGRSLWTETHKYVSSYLAILRDRISELELGRVSVKIDAQRNYDNSKRVDLDIQNRATQLMAIEVTKSILSG